VYEKPKVRRGIDVAVDCEALGAFYRTQDRGETEGAASISKG
jgi:hypothetical protein